MGNGMPPERAVALIVAVLDPGGVPLEALRAPAVSAFVDLAASDDDRGGVVLMVDAVQRALRDLVRAGTVDLDRKAAYREIRLPPRRQHDILDTHTPAEVAAAIRAAADALMQVKPTMESDADLWWSWRSNARCLAARRPKVLWEPEGHPLLFALGLSLAREGTPGEAFDYWQRLLLEATEYLDAEHPQRLATRAVLSAGPNEMKRLGSPLNPS